MRRFSILAIVLALAFCATAVWGQAAPPRQQQRDGAGLGMMCPSGALALPRAQMLQRSAQELQLTADQQTKLRDIFAQHEQVVRPLMQKASEATAALRTAALAPQYDAQNVQALATAAQKAEADVLQARLRAWTQVREVLTAEQATKLKEIMARPRQNAPRDGMRQGQGSPRPGDGPAAPAPQ